MKYDFLKAFCLHKGRKVEIRYILNYDMRINEIITESKYMEQLGYGLPEIARNLALQVNTLKIKEKLKIYFLLFVLI